MDKRYKVKYKMSMLENLEAIKENGVRAFVLGEMKRWKCRKCGAVLCVHRDKCLKCGAEFR